MSLSRSCYSISVQTKRRRCYAVSASPDSPRVSILWLGKLASLICKLDINFTSCYVVEADPQMRLACCWAVKKARLTPQCRRELFAWASCVLAWYRNCIELYWSFHRPWRMGIAIQCSISLHLSALRLPKWWSVRKVGLRILSSEMPPRVWVNIFEVTRRRQVWNTQDFSLLSECRNVAATQVAGKIPM